MRCQDSAEFKGKEYEPFKSPHCRDCWYYRFLDSDFCALVDCFEDDRADSTSVSWIEKE